MYGIEYDTTIRLLFQEKEAAEKGTAAQKGEKQAIIKHREYRLNLGLPG
jgi:hypothetical protein